MVDLSCLVMLLELATCMARSPPVYLWFLNQSLLNISFGAYQKSFFTAFCQLFLFLLEFSSFFFFFPVAYTCRLEKLDFFFPCHKNK